MKKHILFLRLSYWIAALADFVVAALALMPVRMGVTDVVYPMGLVSSIAFSWGVLLLFADRKPLERRWILLPTILVVALLTLTRVVFSIQGSIEFSSVLFLFGVFLVAFMAYSYWNAGRREQLAA